MASKKIFGTANVVSVSPPWRDGDSKIVSYDLTLHEALALQMQIDEACRKINGYNRRTREGRDATVRLQIYAGPRTSEGSHRTAIVVKEGKTTACRKARKRRGDDNV